jgi:hypothetical protein
MFSKKPVTLMPRLVSNNTTAPASSLLSHPRSKIAQGLLAAATY